MNHRSPGRDHLRSLAILGNIETGGARHSVRAVMAMHRLGVVSQRLLREPFRESAL
jgi:hypothetical protein